MSFFRIRKRLSSELENKKIMRRKSNKDELLLKNPILIFNKKSKRLVQLKK
jgi:hypothetical protein